MQQRKTFRTLTLLGAFCTGYIVSDIINGFDMTLVSSIKAEVAGMDAYDLRYDYDFKRAVEYIVEDIVEDCSVSGYVDGDYLYSSSISC